MRVIIRVSALLVVFFSIQAFADVFQPGDVVIYRVGDGSAGLTSAASPVFIDEYKTDGTFVQSIPLPIAVSGSNKRLTATGNATSEGLLTISADGRYIVVTGYDAAVNTANVAGTASATTARVIGRVKISDGSVDTSTTVTDGFDAGNIRGATSSDGSSFWATGSSSGTSGGIHYVNFGATGSTQLSTTVTDLRAGNIFGSQLYVSSAATGFRLATVGSGLPTTSGQTITNLPGFPTSAPGSRSPNQFFFADLSTGVAGFDTLYVADDVAKAIQKYSLVGGNWTANGSVSLLFVQGLAGTVLGNSVTLYVSQGNGGALVTLTDSSGYNATITGPAPFTLANPPANTLFRGLAVVGGQPTNPSGTGSGNPGTVHAGETTTLTVTVAPGGAPFSTGLAVAADLTSIGAVGNQPFVDGGPSNGNEIFTFDAAIQARTAAGPKTLPVSITDAQSRSATTSIDLTVLAELPSLSIQLDSPATRDVPFSGTVAVLDSMDNVVTDYTGTIHFTSSDAGMTVPADYTFTAVDAGVHTFTNGFITHSIGLQTITATDVVNAPITGMGTTRVLCPGVVLNATNDGACAGTTVHLDVTDIVGATYHWDGPNGFSSDVRNPTIDNAAPPESGAYTVNVDIDGCIYQAQTFVTVNPLPTAPAPTNGGPYLTDTTIELFANTVADAYQWSGPNSFTSSEQNPTIANALLANAGTYSLAITMNGCTSPAGTTDVTVTQANRDPVLTPIGNRFVSAGSTLTFTISATDADNDTLTYSAAPLPTGATFDAHTQTFSWTPTSAQTGHHSITFSVDDGNGGTASEQITIGVSPVAPASVSAHFVGVGVTVQWSASSGAAQYRILRRDIAGLLQVIATVDPTPLSYTDLTAPANSASQYSVEATTDGDDSAAVAYAAVSTVPFTNDPLLVNSTPLKAQHIYQLRQAINKLRELAGPPFGDYVFEDDVIDNMPVRTVHIDQLRTAYDDIRATLNLPTFSFTDPSPLPHDKILIRAAHLQELRVAVH